MKIALIGFGLETKSAYEYFKKLDKNTVFEVYDEHENGKLKLPEGVEFFGNFHDFSKIQADLIVRTPAVNPSRLPKNVKTTSVTNLFFENCPAPIIGVTGSKGKGTVSSFIAEILRAAGLKTHLLGNIGIPALDKINEINDQDVVVYELSSFQLWDAQKSPHISILNNIEPDHLDVHDNFEDYVQAKLNIAKNQKEGDFFIFNQENSTVLSAVERIKSNLKSELQPFPNYDLAHVQDGYFLWGDELIFSTEILKIPGEHNQKNACAAMIATFDLLREKGFTLEEIFDFLSERTNGQTFAGCPYAVMGMETALSKPAVASVFMEGLKKFEQIFQEVLLCSGLSPDHAKILSQRMLSIYQGYFLLGRISDDTSYLKNAKKNMIEMYREYRAFHGI